MEVVTCRSCGKLFNYIRGAHVCPVCQKKLEEKFVEVKKYVRENPDVDIKTLSEEMSVSVSQIKRWVREERLVFSEDSPVGLPCESCGTTIKTGRLCEKCKQSLMGGLREATAVPKVEQPQRRQSKENRMRFLD